MRICLIGPTYPYRGGIAHYTTLLAEQLRHEHEVLLLSFSQQYPAWLFPGKSDRDPTERPLKTTAEYRLNPLNPISWWRTVRRISQFQPDFVIFQWWHPFFAPAWAVLTRLIRTKQIVICHNVLPHEQGGRVMRTLFPLAIRLAISAADGYIVHSSADGEKLRHLFPNARYHVTPHPTYAAIGERETAVLPIDLPTDRPLLLFCGFIRPYKGLDILLEALPQLLERLPAHLLIAGEFWQDGAQQIQAQIQRLGLGEHVTIRDEYLPDDLLATCLARADVVVLPYRSATQSGIVQVAFGHLTPVITTNVGGLGEAVLHGVTGLVVPPENPTALAQAMIAYFEDGLKAQFVEAIVEENGRFSWEHLQNNIIQLL